MTSDDAQPKTVYVRSGYICGNCGREFTNEEKDEFYSHMGEEWAHIASAGTEASE